MALFQGKSGKISLGGGGTEVFLAHTTSWSVDSSMDVEATAYFGGSLVEEGFTEKTPGLVDWTVSVEGAVDSTEEALYDAHTTQQLVNVNLYLDGTTRFTGQGYIDSYSVTHAADGKAEFSASIAGNGVLEKETV